MVQGLTGIRDDPHVLLGGTITTIKTDGTREYFPTVGISSAVISTDDRRQKITRAGAVKNAYIHLQAAPGVAKTRVFTLYLNNNPTAIVVTITGAAVDGSDTANSVAVVAGDYIVWSSDGGAATTPAVCTFVTASLELKNT